MACSIRRFDETIIDGARSRGSGVFAAFDWRQMVLEPGPAIEKKARTDRGRVSDFPVEDHTRLTAILGGYSKAQSENSEDTVTWSVFGAVRPDVWMDELLGATFGVRGNWVYEFWKRLPHPETGVREHGPEADLTITGPAGSIVCEAKWNADIDGGQGKNKNMTQLEMRAYGARHGCSSGGQWHVLVVALGPQRYQHAHDKSSVFRRYFEVDGDGYRPTAAGEDLHCRAVTWERILEILGRYPSHCRVADYLRWRLDLGR